MPLCRHGVETYQEMNLHATRQRTLGQQSSELADPLWTDPGLKSESCVGDLISVKKKKRAGGE